MISAWATWTTAGVSVSSAPRGSPGPLGEWADAPLLSKIHPRARRPHPQARMLVQLASAVLGPNSHHGEKLSMLIGTASGSAQPDREFEADLQKRGPSLGGPSLFVYTLPTAPVGEVGIAFGARGPLATINAGLASGLTSVVQAVEEVERGRSPGVLCGALETGTEHDLIALFLVEKGGRRVRGTSGFDPSSTEAATGVSSILELAHALSQPAARTVRARDPQGFWAELHLEARP